MRINHNITALNAHRQLGNNNNAVSKNLEKLSSGLRINRAGDDAAGLAISEKMRGQIRGLEMAGKNANDAISLIQTAEGSLNETHAILQRMRELAVQSTNGTYETAVDRVQLNKELTALKSEVDRIASSTHFNNKKLLNGNLDSTAGGTTAPVTTDYKAGSFGVAEGKSITSVDVDIAKLAHGDSLTIGDKTYMIWGDITEDEADQIIAKGDVPTLANKGLADGVELINISKDKGIITTANLVDKIVGTAALQPSGFSVKKSTTADKGDGGALTAGKLIFTATGNGATSNNLGEVKHTKADGTAGTAGAAVIEKKFIAAKTAAKEEFATATLDASALTKVKADDAINVGGVALKVMAKADYDKLTVPADIEAAVSLDADGKLSLQAVADKINSTAAFKSDNVTVVGTDSLKFTSHVAGQTGDDYAETLSITTPAAGGAAAAFPSGGVTFQIGANGGADQRVTLNVADQSCKTLGIDGISIGEDFDANDAITKITDATNLVSGTRADLGALQNRLEHTIANLGVSVENLTAAESRVRDVDMAKEMMEMTKNNILTQAAQAMLAQANTQPQGVLQLLQ